MNKKRVVIIGTIIFIIGFSLYIHVLFPAYISYASSCRPVEFEENYEQTYISAGQVVLEDGVIYTNINPLFENDKSVLKHERCHVVQVLATGGVTCNYPSRRYLQEAECYLTDSLPDPVFRLIYGDYQLDSTYSAS